MSFKGAKKAIARTPYRIYHVTDGISSQKNKSNNDEDVLVTEWEKDLTVGQKGLEEIYNETNKFVAHWHAALNGQTDFGETLRLFYDLIPDESVNAVKNAINNNNNNNNLETLISTIDEYSDTMEIIKGRVSPLIDMLLTHVAESSNTVKEEFDIILKELKKRKRKKIDLERFNESVLKIEKKGPNLSEKDKINLAKLKVELENATTIFIQHNDYVHNIIPKSLTFLNDFLTCTTTMLVMIMADVFRRSLDTLQSFVDQSNLINDVKKLQLSPNDFESLTIYNSLNHHQLYDLSLEEIEKNWHENFVVTQSKVESQLALLNDPISSHTSKLPRIVLSTAKHGLHSGEKAGKETFNFLKNTIDDRHRARIKPTDPVNGIFRYDSVNLAKMSNDSSPSSLPTVSSSPIKSSDSKSDLHLSPSSPINHTDKYNTTFDPPPVSPSVVSATSDAAVVSASSVVSAASAIKLSSPLQEKSLSPIQNNATSPIQNNLNLTNDNKFQPSHSKGYGSNNNLSKMENSLSSSNLSETGFNPAFSPTTPTALQNKASSDSAGIRADTPSTDDLTNPSPLVNDFTEFGDDDHIVKDETNGNKSSSNSVRIGSPLSASANNSSFIDNLSKGENDKSKTSEKTNEKNLLSSPVQIDKHLKPPTDATTTKSSETHTEHKIPGGLYSEEEGDDDDFKDANESHSIDPNEDLK